MSPAGPLCSLDAQTGGRGTLSEPLLERGDREGHGCWNLIYSLQTRKGGQIVFCAQEPLRPAQFQQGKRKGDIGMLRESKLFLGFLDGSDGKDSACIVGDPGLIFGWGESPGEGNGNPL